METAACFRAASLMQFGTEQNYLELRVRGILNLAKYIFFYLAEGKVITRMEAEMAVFECQGCPTLEFFCLSGNCLLVSASEELSFL